jgi:hypothetical protein
VLVTKISQEHHMAEARKGAELRGGTHQQEGHAAVVAPTPAQARKPARAPEAHKPAGQGADPTKQDQQDGRETRADRTVDKGEADRRVRR